MLPPAASPRQTQSYLRDLLASRGIHPRTKLGQNFLIDLNLQHLIADSAQLEPTDLVLEVGAGTGGLTTLLAQRAGAVVAVEIDPALYRLAHDNTAALPNVTLLRLDALKSKNLLNPELLAHVHEKLRAGSFTRLKLVANLPYSVATPVIANLLLEEPGLHSMTVTMQQELADRLLAAPATKDYGSFSVWVQAGADVELIRRLPPTVFWPRPKVSSAIVRIIPSAEKRSRISDVPFFHTFVRQLFLHRRKTLRTGLAALYRDRLTKPTIDSLLASQHLPPDIRAEQLTAHQFITLADAVQHLLTDGHSDFPSLLHPPS